MYILLIPYTSKQCESRNATQGFLKLVNEEPTKILLIGPGCSTAAQAIAEMADYWNLVMVSKIYPTSPPLLKKIHVNSYFK